MNLSDYLPSLDHDVCCHHPRLKTLHRTKSAQPKHKALMLFGFVKDANTTSWMSTAGFLLLFQCTRLSGLFPNGNEQMNTFPAEKTCRVSK